MAVVDYILVRNLLVPGYPGRNTVFLEVEQALARVLPDVPIVQRALYNDSALLRDGDVLEVAIGPRAYFHGDFGNVLLEVRLGNAVARGDWGVRWESGRASFKDELPTLVETSVAAVLGHRGLTGFVDAMRDAEALLWDLHRALSENRALRAELAGRDVEIEFLRHQVEAITQVLAEAHRTHNRSLAARAMGWTGALLIALVGGAAGGAAEVLVQDVRVGSPVITKYVDRCKDLEGDLAPESRQHADALMSVVGHRAGH